jgi:hypothetical protein
MFIAVGDPNYSNNIFGEAYMIHLSKIVVIITENVIR